VNVSDPPIFAGPPPNPPPLAVTTNSARFFSTRSESVLAFSGLTLTGDGRLLRATTAGALSEAAHVVERPALV
jgi:hypothetical protein